MASTVLIVLLFAGSGAAALIYEVVWQQLLQLVIGSSTVSLGVLLGMFMGGMCLGSLLAPRLIAKTRHPLMVYAALELAIGVMGVGLLVAMPLVTRIYVAIGGVGPAGVLVRAAVAAVCLLPPTCAMGATLPAVARWVESSPQGRAWLGLFYAGNLAGAVAGCLVAGFYLLRVFDMAVTSYVAGALNLAVAAGAWMISRRTQAAPMVGSRAAVSGEWREPETVLLSGSRVEASRRASVGSSGSPGASRTTAVDANTPSMRLSGNVWRLYGTIALSGFCALSAEVVWTRMLALNFGGTVYTFSIILAVFLIGLGVGSSVGAAIGRQLRSPALALGW